MYTYNVIWQCHTLTRQHLYDWWIKHMMVQTCGLPVMTDTSVSMLIDSQPGYHTVIQWFRRLWLKSNLQRPYLKRWWISNMNTHHVTLRQRIHTKRYIKWDHENRCRKTPKQTKNYHWRPTLWTQTTRWLTILIRGRRTWTSECRTPGCFVDYEEIKR